MNSFEYFEKRVVKCDGKGLYISYGGYRLRPTGGTVWGDWVGEEVSTIINEHPYGMHDVEAIVCTSAVIYEVWRNKSD